MRIINRSAVIIQPKAPLLVWLHSVDPSSRDLSLEELRDEPTVYLLPDCECVKTFAAALKRNFRTIFEDQLEGWYTDHEGWPAALTFQQFQSWFDVSFHSIVGDLSDGPLFTEDL